MKLAFPPVGVEVKYPSSAKRRRVGAEKEAECERRKG